MLIPGIQNHWNYIATTLSCHICCTAMSNEGNLYDQMSRTRLPKVKWTRLLYWILKWYTLPFRELQFSKRTKRLLPDLGHTLWNFKKLVYSMQIPYPTTIQGWNWFKSLNSLPVLLLDRFANVDLYTLKLT